LEFIVLVFFITIAKKGHLSTIFTLLYFHHYILFAMSYKSNLYYVIYLYLIKKIQYFLTLLTKAKLFLNDFFMHPYDSLRADLVVSFNLIFNFCIMSSIY